MRQRAGVSLVELMVVVAIVGVLLTALFSTFITTTRANRVNERLAANQQNFEAAAQLLKYEVGMAGYRGTDQDPSDPNNPNKNYHLRKFVESGSSRPTLQVNSSSTPHTVTIRYFEDRYVSPPALQTVAFSIGTVNGVSTLLRNGEAAVEGISNLRVVNYRLRNRTEQSTMPTTISNLVGVTVELTFTDPALSPRLVSVALPNPQCTMAPPCS